MEYSLTAPNPPVILSVTTINSQSVHVIWKAPTQPNGILISYTITYSIDHGNNITNDVPYNGELVSIVPYSKNFGNKKL